MIVQYIKCTCLVTLFGFIIRFIVPEFYNKNIELMMIINMIIILLSYNFKFFDRIIPLLCLCTVTIVSYILYRIQRLTLILKYIH